MYDWLIVGAGFSGAVLAERIASQLGKRVLVVDRRPHVAGNASDSFDAAGVLVHHYGPHLFHTNSIKVWQYLSQFTEWRPYAHRVRAEVDGIRVPVPFNLTSLRMLFPHRAADALEAELVGRYGRGARVPILKLREDSAGPLRGLADFVYEKIFHGYTTKHWGLTPEQLAPSVTGRVPVHVSHDDRYFHDSFQAMPKDGYTAMFDRMLSHPNIEVRLNTDYCSILGSEKFNRMIYTGPIDSFFDHEHGVLPYRSLRFEFDTLSRRQFQDVAQVNYPNAHRYTRIVEYKHVSGQELERTTIVREFPEAHEHGKNEPFYPIPRDEYRLIYNKYRAEADQLRSVVFCGRLADYQYYNMDQVTARALMVFEQEVARDASHSAARLRRGGDVQPTSAAA